jgi:membrane fusion protein (multidrug efflux system)
MESVAKQMREPAALQPEKPRSAPETKIATAESPKKRRPWFVLGAIAAAVLFALGGYLVWNHGKESTDDAQVEADVVPLAPRIAGLVQHVAVIENQHVKQGDLLVELDDADVKARVAQAQAELETAQSGVVSADANAQKATLDLRRSRALRGSNVVSQQHLDDAQATFSSAQANARLARARVDAAEAALDQAKLQLSYTKIFAPAAGEVSRLAVHEGQLVQVGQPMMTLVPEQVYVVANFKETQIGDMKAGERAVVQVDAFPGRKLEAKVESLSGGTGARFSLLPPDNASGNFVKVVQRVPVRLALVNPPADLDLRAGLSASVTVYVN